MNVTFKKLTVTVVFLSFALAMFSQGFLRASGKQIINENGPFIIRSIGTGNRMIQEGYMMQSTDVGIHTHIQYRNKLNDIMGVERTNAFYDFWLGHHFTKTDPDLMKAWGFNAVRSTSQCKWFTIGTEAEQRQPNGTLSNTWPEKFIDVSQLQGGEFLLCVLQNDKFKCDPFVKS